MLKCKQREKYSLFKENNKYNYKLLCLLLCMCVRVCVCGGMVVYLAICCMLESPMCRYIINYNKLKVKGQAGGIVVKRLDYCSKRPGFESRRKFLGFSISISHLLVGLMSA